MRGATIVVWVSVAAIALVALLGSIEPRTPAQERKERLEKIERTCQAADREFVITKTAWKCKEAR